MRSILQNNINNRDVNSSPNHSEPYLNYGKFWNAMRLSFLSHFHLLIYVCLALGLLPKHYRRVEEAQRFWDTFFLQTAPHEMD